MIWSLTALIKLYESEFKDITLNTDQDPNTFFILTNRLNQNPLENLFSIMRQKNGYTRNPTSRMVRSCFASICSFSLMKASDKCNCEEDKENFLTINELKRSEVMKSTCDFEVDTNLINENPNEILNTFFQNNDDDESHLEATSSTVLDCTLENNSVVYFAGYLAKRCIDNFQCENCKNILVDNNNIGI